MEEDVVLLLLRKCMALQSHLVAVDILLGEIGRDFPAASVSESKSDQGQSSQIKVISGA